MRAILLAAGFGTRLRPLTDAIPKCLVPIAGQPLLSIWLDRLSEAGIGPYLINTHYLAEQVTQYVERSKYREQVTLVYEEVLRGTAGTLLSNIEFFGDEDGMLIHADNYCLADLDAFKRAHEKRPHECLLSMMTFRANNPELCGIVELDHRNVAVKFHEKVKNPPGNLANGAIYILSQKFLSVLKEQFSMASDFSTEILPSFVGYIYCYETNATFLDIGTPQNYKLANL